jgi:hypothetical protein
MPRTALAIAFSFGLAACGHGAPPPPDYPTLPPESNTAVGLLIDQASTIGLSEAQRVKLEEIDRELHRKNDGIDAELADLDAPAPQPHRDGGDAHHGGGGSGAGGGGMGRHRGGGMGGMGGGRRGTGGGSAATPPSTSDTRSTPPPLDPRDRAAEAARLHSREHDNEQASLAEAMQLLDADQQNKARSLLADHGFHDATRTDAPAHPAPSPDADAGSATIVPPAPEP